MTTFDEREQAFETKYAHDQELLFKIKARTRKFLALWAAQRMGQDEEDTLDYAKQIIDYGVKNSDEANVIDHVFDDLKEAGVCVTREKVAEKLAVLRGVAEKQLLKDD